MGTNYVLLHIFINTNPAVSIVFFQGLAVGNKQSLCYHLGEVKYRMLSKKLLWYPRACHYFGILDFNWLTFICNWLSTLMSCKTALNDITERQMCAHTLVNYCMLVPVLFFAIVPFLIPVLCRSSINCSLWSNSSWSMKVTHIYSGLLIDDVVSHISISSICLPGKEYGSSFVFTFDC